MEVKVGKRNKTNNEPNKSVEPHNSATEKRAHNKIHSSISLCK